MDEPLISNIKNPSFRHASKSFEDSVSLPEERSFSDIVVSFAVGTSLGNGGTLFNILEVGIVYLGTTCEYGWLVLRSWLRQSN